jgi:lipoprotein-releasing system ATP-binding protein
VVRALINRPKLLLADEPTGALDESNAGRLVDLLVELNEAQQLAVVMVSHDLKLAERMGKVVELRAGKIANDESH